jgi:hypothetical protein
MLVVLTAAAGVLAGILRLLAGLLPAALLPLAGLALATLMLAALLMLATLMLTALLTGMVGVLGILVHQVLSFVSAPQLKENCEAKFQLR